MLGGSIRRDRRSHRRVWTTILTLSLVGSATVTSAASTAVAAPPSVASPTVVYPTGEFPDDVIAVQEAVDGGGTVLLKTTNAAGVPTAFAFGDTVEESSGVIVRNRDVAIVGERTPTARATIEGGFIPVFGAGNVTMRVDNLRFVDPILSAVIVIRSTGAQITRNEVSGVVGLDLGFATEGRGFKFLGNANPLHAITGTILLRDNVVRDLDASLSEAFVFDEVAADVTIASNTVERAAGGGVLAIAQHGDMTISQNSFAPGPDPGVGAFGSGVAIYGGEGRVTVTENQFTLENTIADGVLLWGDEGFGGRIVSASITKNRFDLRHTLYGAVTLIDQVDGTYVGQNRVVGTSGSVFAIVPSGFVDAATANRNAFIGNELASTNVDVAHILLLDNAINTTVRGRSGTVFDGGVGTSITGLTPMKGAAPPVSGRRPLAPSPGFHPFAF